MPSRGCRPAVGVRAMVVALAVSGALPLGVRAQKLDDLQTPPSPGFAILGLSPTVIERPTTPRALALGLVSATKEGSVIPESYALEFSPYWLAPHAGLLFENRYRPGFGQLLKQSFALSVATDRSAGGDTTRLGIGARVQLLPGRPSPASDSVEAAIRAATDSVSSLKLALRLAKTAADSARLNTHIGNLGDRLVKLSTDFKNLDQNRSGIRWEIAGAFASSFPSATFSGGDLTAWGVWTTLSLRPTAQHADFLLLARYQHLDAPLPAGAGADETAVKGQEVLDAGASLIYGNGPLSVSGEFLGRVAFHVSNAQDGSALVRYDNSYRVTGTVQYQIQKNLALEWTLGQGFKAAGEDAGKLIALLGLKWAAGKGLDLP